MPLTPAERSLRASLAAHTRWANTDRVERQRLADSGQAGLLRRFAAEVDPEGLLPADEREKRARSLLTAHMKRLALASSKSRRGGAPPGAVRAPSVDSRAVTGSTSMTTTSVAHVQGAA